MTIPCAVIHAGDELCIAIPVRKGRYPVKVANLQPNIEWVCQDGRIERLLLTGESGEENRKRIEDILKQSDGVLIAEVNEMDKIDLENVSHWLLEIETLPARERQS